METKKRKRGRPPKVKWLKDGVLMDFVEPKDKIITEAIKLFNKKGFYGASIREIADAAGATKPVIYYHYDSKEGLYKEIVSRALDEVYALHIEPIKFLHIKCATDILLDIANSFFDWCSENRARANLIIFMLTTRDPAFTDICGQYMKKRNKILKPVFLKGVESGNIPFKDPNLALTAFNSLLIGFELLSSALDTDLTCKTYARKAVDILLGNCEEQKDD